MVQLAVHVLHVPLLAMVLTRHCAWKAEKAMRDSESTQFDEIWPMFRVMHDLGQGAVQGPGAVAAASEQSWAAAEAAQPFAIQQELTAASRLDLRSQQAAHASAQVQSLTDLFSLLRRPIWRYCQAFASTGMALRILQEGLACVSRRLCARRLVHCPKRSICCKTCKACLIGQHQAHRFTCRTPSFRELKSRIEKPGEAESWGPIRRRARRSGAPRQV